MIRVSKNRMRGALITDLNEIVQLANDKQSVVLKMGANTHFVRPAAFIMCWQLNMILRYKIYHCLPINSNEKTRL